MAEGGSDGVFPSEEGDEDGFGSEAGDGEIEAGFGEGTDDFTEESIDLGLAFVDDGIEPEASGEAEEDGDSD